MFTVGRALVEAEADREHDTRLQIGAPGHPLPEEAQAPLDELGLLSRTCEGVVPHAPEVAQHDAATLLKTGELLPGEAIRYWAHIPHEALADVLDGVCRSPVRDLTEYLVNAFLVASADGERLHPFVGDRHLHWPERHQA